MPALCWRDCFFLHYQGAGYIVSCTSCTFMQVDEVDFHIPLPHRLSHINRLIQIFPICLTQSICCRIIAWINSSGLSCFTNMNESWSIILSQITSLSRGLRKMEERRGKHAWFNVFIKQFICFIPSSVLHNNSPVYLSRQCHKIRCDDCP